jgi:hypothetical protein
MPENTRFMTMPKLMFGLVVLMAACLCAPALNARDQVEYGRYLGVRLQMWAEAYEVLDKVIASGSPAEKSRAKRSKAEVMKTEADVVYVDDANKRMERYEEAVEIFGEATEPADVLSKGVMQLDLALSMRRLNATKARQFCDEAREAMKKVVDELEGIRFNNVARFKEHYLSFSGLYFRMCYASYVKGMTYDAGSADREAQFRQCEADLDIFSFALDDPTEDSVLTYPLRGDIEIARGNFEAAAGQFISCVSYLDGEAATEYIGRLALEHGYLRAAELLTTELDFEPKNLQKCIDLYAEAFTKYGSITELDFYLKRLALYRISAVIKLGDESKIKAAIDSLFKLANDRDITFRRQALMVLADIAARDNLDNEVRFRCADTVYKGIETSPVLSLMLKNIQAYQSMLVACKDVKTFETYAPVCFTRIGNLFHGMFRFLDAALIYKEGCYRTAYFQEKFAADATVPEHMKDRCELIIDGKTLNGFPGEMANQFARNAGFLIHKDYGDPKNKYFQDLSKAADLLKATFAGGQAKMDLAYKSAKAMYDRKQYHPAAVRMVNLPATYKSYHVALYIGAKSYYNVSEDANAPRNNKRGENNKADYLYDIEDADWYQEQLSRHATDLATLPAALYTGIEKPHWDAILDSKTPDQLVNWHKAAYYFKKYFLFEVKKSWDEISPLLDEKSTLADAIGALAQVRNGKWLRDNPSGAGDPDPDMKRIGYAVYDLAYLLRNPPKGLTEEERSALLTSERDLVLAIMRPYWKWFGAHLAGSENYKQGALRLSFGALSEARDEDACESVYRAYIEAFPDDAVYINWAVIVLYRILIDKLRPKTSAMAQANSKLISYSNLLKKNSFERINGAAKDSDGKPLPGFAEDEKRLTAAKGAHEKRLILAEHFWQRWMLEQFIDSPKNAELRDNLPDLKDTIKRKWDEMAEAYPKRWADAVKAEYDTQIKKDNFKGVRDELNKAVASGTNYEIVDKIKAVQDAEAAKKEPDNTRIGQLNDLLVYISLATDELAYFTGTIFIYEFAGFLDQFGAEILERARPSTTRILKYYEESRVRRGEGGLESLLEDEVKLLGNQYFLIRDWSNAIKYLDDYVARFGGERVWGKEESIAVDQRTKIIGKSSAARELQVKYQLGKSHLERYKETKDIEDLKKAALHMRRCWSYNLVRDSNELNNKAYAWVNNGVKDDIYQLQKVIEDYYVYISADMAEIFLLLHEAGDVKIAWPKYQDQATRTLEQSKEHPLQDVPADKAGYLWEASQIHLKVWVQFRLLGRYQFRSEFRANLEGWLKLMIRWIETYGKEDKGIARLKGNGVESEFREAYNFATTEGNFAAAHLPANIVDYLNRLKGYAKRIEELAKKNKLNVKTEEPKKDD